MAMRWQLIVWMTVAGFLLCGAFDVLLNRDETTLPVTGTGLSCVIIVIARLLRRSTKNPLATHTSDST
jgi:hypothetical protein